MIETDPTFTSFDYLMMREALSQARLAGEKGDVPVGAVVVYQGRPIASASNSREALQDATAHAEILAIQAASRELASWHLVDCSLYVTLEPCTMCAGAILNARLARVIFAAPQPKTGAFVSQLQLLDSPLNHGTVYAGGLLAEDAIRLMQQWFQRRRLQKKRLGGPGDRRQAALLAWQKRLATTEDESSDF